MTTTAQSGRLDLTCLIRAEAPRLIGDAYRRPAAAVAYGLALAGHVAENRDLEPARLAHLALLLHIDRVADDVWRLMPTCGDPAGQARRWNRLRTAVPPLLAAPPATLEALAHLYAASNGPALEAVNAALDADRHYRPAVVIRAALDGAAVQGDPGSALTGALWIRANVAYPGLDEAGPSWISPMRDVCRRDGILRQTLDGRPGDEAAAPGGCRYCGRPDYGHENTWVPDLQAFHTFTQPTEQEIRARMLARRWATAAARGE